MSGILGKSRKPTTKEKKEKTASFKKGRTLRIKSLRALLQDIRYIDTIVKKAQ